VRKIREVLRLYFAAALSVRPIARSLRVSPSTVGNYRRRAEVAGLTWSLPDSVDDDRSSMLPSCGFGLGSERSARKASCASPAAASGRESSMQVDQELPDTEPAKVHAADADPRTPVHEAVPVGQPGPAALQLQLPFGNQPS